MRPSRRTMAVLRGTAVQPLLAVEHVLDGQDVRVAGAERLGLDGQGALEQRPPHALAPLRASNSSSKVPGQAAGRQHRHVYVSTSACACHTEAGSGQWKRKQASVVRIVVCGSLPFSAPSPPSPPHLLQVQHRQVCQGVRHLRVVGPVVALVDLRPTMIQNKQQTNKRSNDPQMIHQNKDARRVRACVRGGGGGGSEAARSHGRWRRGGLPLSVRYLVFHKAAAAPCSAVKPRQTEHRDTRTRCARAAP